MTLQQNKSNCREYTMVLQQPRIAANWKTTCFYTEFVKIRVAGEVWQRLNELGLETSPPLSNDVQL